ncbi:MULTISPECIES: hypothetical protein [unclassified Mesorhizobium]
MHDAISEYGTARSFAGDQSSKACRERLGNEKGRPSGGLLQMSSTA